MLIDHEDGLFIYDTGFDLAHMQTYIPGDQPLQTPEQTLPAQLAKCGLKPSDVGAVLSSHLHIDHAVVTSSSPRRWSTVTRPSTLRRRSPRCSSA